MRRIVAALLGLTLTAVAPAQGAWVHTAAPGEAPVAAPVAELLVQHAGLGQLLLAQVPSNGTLQLYGWTGTTWSTVTTGTLAITDAAGLAFDPVRQQLVVASRPTASSNGEVYEWTPGGGWILRATHNLQVEALCWHPPTQRVVAWEPGGVAQWDGASWTTIPGTAHAQATRLDLAFDPARGVLVGHTLNSTLNSTTLEWDGATVTAWPLQPAELSISWSSDFGGVIGVRPWVNATYRWDGTGSWHALTDAPGFQPPFGGPIDVAFDAGLQGSVARRRGQTGLFAFDANAPAVQTTLIVDPGQPTAFVNIETAMRAAGPGNRIKVTAPQMPFSPEISIDRPVHIDVVAGLTLNQGAIIHLGAGERSSITGGVWQHMEVSGPSAEMTFRGLTCTNVQLWSGNLRCERVTVLGGQSAFDPLWLYAISGNAQSTLVLDDCTVMGTPGQLAPGYFPQTFVLPTPAVDGDMSLTVIHSRLVGGSGNLPAPAVEVTAPALIAGASSLTTSGAPAFVGPVQVTSDVTWNGGALPGALAPIAYIEPPATASLGQPLSIGTVVPPGELLVVAIGARTAPVVLPGSLLPLQLDPPSAIVAGVQLSPGGNVTIPVPGAPALEGLETWWQGVTFGGSAVQATNLRSVTLR